MDAIHLVGIVIAGIILLFLFVLFAACWLSGTISQHEERDGGGGV